jgi:hypothetical protein
MIRLMSVWYAKNLGDALLADEALGCVVAAFSESYENAGRPAGMGLFVRHESEGRLHCEVVVYFTPAAADVARALGAAPCRTPSRDGLSLLAGADTSMAPRLRP